MICRPKRFAKIVENNVSFTHLTERMVFAQNTAKIMNMSMREETAICANIAAQVLQMIGTMSDEELATYMGIMDMEDWRQVIQALTPARRAVIERMHEVELQLWRGEVPTGVILCGR